jgi:hypothetical protein
MRTSLAVAICGYVLLLAFAAESWSATAQAHPYKVEPTIKCFGRKGAVYITVRTDFAWNGIVGKFAERTGKHPVLSILFLFEETPAGARTLFRERVLDLVNEWHMPKTEARQLLERRGNVVLEVDPPTGRPVKPPPAPRAMIAACLPQQ